MAATTKASKPKASKPKASSKTMRPNALAKELGGKVDGKAVRAFLRGQFPRKAEDRNTSWELTAAQVKAVREHFKPKGK